MASPDFSDGCMIALYPPADLAEELAVDGGLPPEELHVTVAYLGDAVDANPDVLAEVITELAAREPLAGTLSGLARFTGGEKDVLVALVDSAALEDLRRDTLDVLASRGIGVPRDHGYCAHLPLSYLDPDDPSPLARMEPAGVDFTALSAVHGTDRTDIPLEHPIEAPAREAFAAGWAASGGPMTERVRTASRTAVQLAIESADDPDILKATLDLGALEGMWALLFQRREEQQAKHAALVAAAWQPLIDRDAVAAAVDRFLRNAGLAEADNPDRPGVRAAAKAAAQNMLAAIASLPGWQKLRTALRAAIAAGRAEGMVDAVAVAAERAGTLGLDWDIAFQHAYDALERLDALWTDTEGWLARTLNRATADLGRVLADGAEQGLPRDNLIDAAMDVLTGTDQESVAFIVDWAMTTAADQGALSLYQSEGVTSADWITAGDGRVCETCLGNEAGSPWVLTEFPMMPSHPLCRCVPAASVSLAGFAHWFS